MMANAYVAVKLRDLPILLASALFRGRIARGAHKLEGALTPEDRLTTLQGLALITLGFVLQVIGIVSGVAFAPPPAP